MVLAVAATVWSRSYLFVVATMFFCDRASGRDDGLGGRDGDSRGRDHIFCGRHCGRDQGFGARDRGCMVAILDFVSASWFVVVATVVFVVDCGRDNGFGARDRGFVVAIAFCVVGPWFVVVATMVLVVATVVLRSPLWWRPRFWWSRP